MKLASIGKILLILLRLLPIAGVMLLMGESMLKFDRLTCQHSQPAQIDCLLERYHWLGLIKAEETPLKGVREAKAKPPEYSNKDGPVYPIALVSAEGEHSLSGIYGREYALRINNFIEATEPKLTLLSNKWWEGPSFFGLVLGAVVLGVWALTSQLFGRFRHSPASAYTVSKAFGEEAPTDQFSYLSRPRPRTAVTPLTWGRIIWAGLVLVIGVAGLFTLGSGATLNCRRLAGREVQCNFESGSFGFSLDEILIPGLHGARVDQETRYWPVVLATANGDLPLNFRSSFFFDQDWNQEVAMQISHFLDSSQPALSIQRSHSGNLLWGGVYLLIGLALAAWGERRRLAEWLRSISYRQGWGQMWPVGPGVQWGHVFISSALLLLGLCMAGVALNARPADPTETNILPWFLIPFIVFPGSMGLVGLLWTFRKSIEPAAMAYLPNNLFRLWSKLKRKPMIGGLGLFAFIWNTSIWAIIIVFIKASPEVNWGAIGFLSLFVLAGVGLIWGTIHEARS